MTKKVSMRQIFSLGIKHLIDKKGRGTQTRMAHELGVDSGYFSAVVRGKKNCPDDLKQEVAEKLDCQIEDIYVLGKQLAAAGEMAGNEQTVSGDGNITAGGNIGDVFADARNNPAYSDDLVALCELLAGFASPVEIRILKEKYEKRKNEVMR